MWAQLPWLQVGVKQASPTLIMDIVSMKLASNALILLVGLDIDFTINFLNRCRVNAINGVQVYRLYFYNLSVVFQLFLAKQIIVRKFYLHCSLLSTAFMIILFKDK